MADDPTPRATTIAGRYELERRLAVGGMATVHLARDSVLDRPVAVKVLHPQYAADPAYVTRFKREAQAAARLGHPNIVAVYDWGPDGDSYYLVMAYLEGPTLAELLADEGPLPADRALALAADVTAGLAAAHAEGTVHRDIKPSNIVVGPSGTAKVTDFGIARAQDPEERGADLTEAGSVIGTASYLSPEQARGLAVDPRSDLYSLGVVLFEMVTGRRPFSGPSPMAIIRQHIDDRPPEVRTVEPSVPAELADLIERLMAKDPADRPPTAQAVADEVEAIRSRLPVASAPPDDTGDATTLMAPDGMTLDGMAPGGMALDGMGSGGVAVGGTAREGTALDGVGSEGVALGGTAREGTAPDGRSSDPRFGDALAPTAVMPPSARPDAGPARPAPPDGSSPGAGRSAWPVLAGAIGVVGVVVLLLFLAPRIGGDDGSSEPTATTDGTTPATTAPPSTDDPVEETVPVPDLVGSSQAEAEGAIDGLGLTPVVETTELEPDDDRVGRVVSQSPEPAQVLPIGGEVRIVVGVARSTTTTAVETTTTTEATETTTPTTEATSQPDGSSSTASG